jgi:hypothetical protein
VPPAARLLADWPAAAVGLPSALWSGQEPAHLLRVKVGGVTVVITGGTAIAIIMVVAADGTASQTKIAVESYLLWRCAFEERFNA